MKEAVARSRAVVWRLAAGRLQVPDRVRAGMMARKRENLPALGRKILEFNILPSIDGGEGGIRTHVPVSRQDAFEAPPLRPLRYLSATLWYAQVAAPRWDRSIRAARAPTLAVPLNRAYVRSPGAANTE